MKPARSDKSPFISKAELAEYLGLSPFTINSWVSERREIKFIKMGSRVMFRKTDVDQWVERNLRSPQ